MLFQCLLAYLPMVGFKNIFTRSVFTHLKNTFKRENYNILLIEMLSVKVLMSIAFFQKSNSERFELNNVTHPTHL